MRWPGGVVVSRSSPGIALFSSGSVRSSRVTSAPDELVLDLRAVR